jgi:hypothetical protein
MFALISGIQCLWPDKDRLVCDNEPMGIRGPKIQIGTSIRSFNLFERTRIRSASFFRFVNKLPILAGPLIVLFANSALATPSYVQANYAVPQTPQTAVTVPYTATQAATDLNVVIGRMERYDSADRFGDRYRGERLPIGGRTNDP